jgi:hypothetical protein
MQSVEAIQEVSSLPRATASHQPGSAPRWREATNGRSRVEHVSRGGIEPRKGFASRGPARDTHPRGPAPRRGNRGQSPAAGTQSLPGCSWRDGAEATGGGDQLMLRQGERGNACAPPQPPVEKSRLIGASTARTKRPWERPVAPPGRSIQQNTGPTGTAGRAGARRPAGGACGSLRGAEERGPPRLPPQTRTGPPLGTASRERRARGRRRGRHARAPCRPWDLGQRRRRRAASPHHGRTGARDAEPAARPAAPGTDRHAGTGGSREGGSHARPSWGRGNAGRRFRAPPPAQRPRGGAGHGAQGQGQPGKPPGDLTRATRQRPGLAATGRAPVASQAQRAAPPGGAARRGGQERGPGRRAAAGGDRRAGL